VRKIYFDNSATTPLDTRVLDTVHNFSKEFYGNPSSIHSFGRKVKVKLEEAREILAEFINADPSEIYFTSGGTEANNFIVRGIAQTLQSDYNVSKVYSTAGEHQSVLATLDDLEKYGIEHSLLKLNRDSSLNLVELSNVQEEHSFISIIHTNNETGAKNDVREIVRKLKKKNIFVHTDAVQAFGKEYIDVKKMGVDALSASAHKIGGPKGVGLAFIKNGTPISQIIFGGAQERNRRSGTENIAGIIGFAEAVKICKLEMESNFKHVQNLKRIFSEGLRNIFSENISFNGGENVSPYILSVTFDPNVYKNDTEAILMFFDINGIAVSAGSACSSGTLKPSRVIKAARRNEDEAKSTIRISFGKQNTIDEVEYTLDVFKKFKTQFEK